MSYLAPPAQIRTCPIKAYGSHLGYVAAKPALGQALVRTRSSACDTLSRPCVRCVLCPLAFPLAPALGSTRSSAAETAPFAGLPATTAGSDFSRSFIVGYGSSPSRRGPAGVYRYCPSGRARNLPVPAHGASAHAKVFDHAGSAGRSRIAHPAMLPSASLTASAPESIYLSRLYGWPMHSPVNASPRPSRTPAHDLGLMRFATPSSRGTCTPYSMPVSRRTKDVERQGVRAFWQDGSRGRGSGWRAGTSGGWPSEGRLGS